MGEEQKTQYDPPNYWRLTSRSTDGFGPRLDAMPSPAERLGDLHRANAFTMREGIRHGFDDAKVAARAVDILEDLARCDLEFFPGAFRCEFSQRAAIVPDILPRGITEWRIFVAGVVRDQECEKLSQITDARVISPAMRAVLPADAWKAFDTIFQHMTNVPVLLRPWESYRAREGEIEHWTWFRFPGDRA